MASKYWIKLYHEILDDPKMMRLSETLFSRCIKLFLLAGDFDESGILPSIDDIAWRLRIPYEELESDLIELQKLNIVTQFNGIWRITRWEERQGAMSEKHRSRLRRKEQHRLEYQEQGPAHVGGSTDAQPPSDRKRDRIPVADIDKDIDKEEKKNKRIGSAADILRVLSTASGMVAFPPKENERIEQIWALLDQYGEEAVTEALKLNFDRWINTKSKSGLTYKRTNFGWVDWAQEELAGGSPGGEKSFIERLRSGEFADG